MPENRLTERLSNYWNLIKKEKDTPEYSQINTSAIHDIWQQCAVLIIQPAAATTIPVMRFHQIGEKLRNIYAPTLLGKELTMLRRNSSGEIVLRQINLVFEKHTPLTNAGQFVSDANKVIKYRSCLLPFSSSDGKISHIVVGINWQET